MAVRDVLLTRITQHCKQAGISERDFGWAAVQDGRFVERLRAGKATLKLIERAEDFLALPLLPTASSPTTAEASAA